MSLNNSTGSFKNETDCYHKLHYSVVLEQHNMSKGRGLDINISD